MVPGAPLAPDLRPEGISTNHAASMHPAPQAIHRAPIEQNGNRPQSAVHQVLLDCSADASRGPTDLSRGPTDGGWAQTMSNSLRFCRGWWYSPESIQHPPQPGAQPSAVSEPTNLGLQSSHPVTTAHAEIPTLGQGPSPVSLCPRRPPTSPKAQVRCSAGIAQGVAQGGG